MRLLSALSTNTEPLAVSACQECGVSFGRTIQVSPLGRVVCTACDAKRHNPPVVDDDLMPTDDEWAEDIEGTGVGAFTGDYRCDD